MKMLSGINLFPAIINKKLTSLFLASFLVACGGGDETTPDENSGGGTNQPQNRAPVAEAGSNQTTQESTSVTLSGSGTDQDGNISSFLWSQVSGISVTINNATSASATFDAPEVSSDETLTFQLMVTDDDGATGVDTVDVMVTNSASNSGNENPFVNAGNDFTANENTRVTLTGSATDTDGTISTFQWTQTSGVNVALSSANLASTSFTAPEVSSNEALTFELVVTDNQGGTSSDSVSVTILDVPETENTAPTVDAGVDQTVDESAQVTLNATASDVDGTINSYQWTQTGGISVTIVNSNQASATFTAPEVDEDVTLTFSVTATDDDDASATDTLSVSVTNLVPNILPTVSAGTDQSVEVGDEVELMAIAEDTDGTIQTYSWRQVSGDDITLTGSDTTTLSFIAPVVTELTNFEFEVTVTDDRGDTAQDTVTVSVNTQNAEPTITAEGPQDSVYEGESITLTAEASDSDGSIESFLWEQVAGDTIELETTDTAQIIFTAPVVNSETIFTFSVTATDNRNATATSNVSFTVVPKIFNAQAKIASVALNNINSPNDIVSADMDGDGDMDVVIADDSSLRWYENRNGQFGKDHLISSNRSLFVTVNDIDDDGDMDIITNDIGTGYARLFINTDHNSFNSIQLEKYFADSVRAADIIDINNDGYKDIIISGGQYNNTGVAIFYNDTLNNFSLSEITTGEFTVYDTEVADLDGDSDLDIIMTWPHADKIVWVEQLEDGSFGVAQTVTQYTDFAVKVKAVDIDKDGDMDLVSTSRNDDKVAWYENLGNAQFGVQRTLTSSLDGASSLSVADVDADGDMDIFATGLYHSSEKIVWFENQGNKVFSAEQELVTGISEPEAIDIADINGDGHLDLIYVNQDYSYARWRMGNGKGLFSSSLDISNTIDGPWRVEAVDLDQDGDLDLLTGAYDDNDVMWYENDGSNEFYIPHVIDEELRDVMSVIALDMDGDDDLDLVATAQYYDDFVWYENDGSQNFSSAVSISSNLNSPNKIVTADIDADGDLDLITASSRDDKITWFANIGSGNFVEQTALSTSADSAIDVVVGDIDGDGDLDIASASHQDDKIAWYENLGSGTFNTTEYTITTSADGARAVALADIDGDGDLDAISASEYNNTVAWYMNNGNKTFSAALVVSSNEYYADHVAIGDMDNDGDIDIVVAAYRGDKVTVYENDGFGNFLINHVVSTTEDGATWIELADVDADGDLDIIVASGADDEDIEIYENRTITKP